MSRNQLTALARPFPQKYIKEAPSGHGTYVDHEIVNQALLLLLGPFSFQIEQVLYNPDGLLDGCTASLTCTIDGREVTITEAGDCEHPKNCPSQGDRLKKAASDALKRCAMRLGCGIHLWVGTRQQDFFLFDSLTKENAEAGAKPAASGEGFDSPRSGLGPKSDEQPASATSTREGNESTTAASPESTSPSGTPGVSKARRESLKARCMALQADGVGVADAREGLNLPLVDSCDDAQLTKFEGMVDTLEAALTAPFVDVSA